MKEWMEDWQQCPKCHEWSVDIGECFDPNFDDLSCGIWLDAFCKDCGWKGQIWFYYGETSWDVK